MIYINTNTECISHAVSLTKDQESRAEAIGYDENYIASNVAEMADLSRLAYDVALSSDETFEYTTNNHFRDWRGGSIVQFHKSWGSLLAYDNESEFVAIEKLSAAIDAHLAALAEGDLAELEACVAREREQEAE